ncbi:hypothetical protein B0H19DRAFT_1267382 [Mycena capillaripes]|nr:hypothetical protein B0H19DRAFT_1267382 [Mycena capillaripes]
MSMLPPRKDNNNNNKRPEKRKTTMTEDKEEGGSKRRRTEDMADGGGMAAILAFMQQQAAAQAVRDATQAERDQQMMDMFVASRVLPPGIAPVVPLWYTPPTRLLMLACHRGDYIVPVSEDRSSMPSEEVQRRKKDKWIMEKRARKAEKEKKKKEKRREKSAEDASGDKPADVQVMEFPGDQATGFPAASRWLLVLSPSARRVPVRIKKALKKSKPAAGKKKLAILSSDMEVEEIALVVIPCTYIDRAAERLLEAKQKLADVERKNRDLRQLVWELRDEVHQSSEGSSQLAQFVAEEKEEVEKKKKHAEIDALANTDGGSDKSDDAEDVPKVKEERMNEEVIVITDLEDEEELVEKICRKHLVKGKGRRLELDDEEVESPKDSEDEENTDPNADVEVEDAGKQMLEPPIVTEDVPKSDD